MLFFSMSFRYISNVPHSGRSVSGTKVSTMVTARPNGGPQPEKAGGRRRRYHGCLPARSAGRGETEQTADAAAPPVLPAPSAGCSAEEPTLLRVPARPVGGA